jgi:AraC-like DNA-binding protein
MLFKIVLPPEELKDWVAYYFFMEESGADDPNTVTPVVARGSINLIIQYRSNIKIAGNEQTTFPKIFLDGNMNKHLNFITNSLFGACGIAFYPFAIQKFFDINSREVVETLIDGSLLVKNAYSTIREELFYAITIPEKAKVLNSFLLKKIRVTKTTDQNVAYLVKQIVDNKGMVNIENILKNLSIGRRQIERKFREHVGFPIKYYSRIIRFQSTLLTQFKSLTDLAYDFNYADQAHFIREFKEFSGLSPREYFKGDPKIERTYIELVEC